MVMIPSMCVLIRIIALLLVGTALADARPGERVVVVSSDGAFANALLPAGMEVVAIGTVATPATVELPSRSRELADRQAAAATVWLLAGPGGTTLVTYDRSVDRLLVRGLPYGSPLSAAQAAETARMARTMLRALRVTQGDGPPPVDVPPPVVSEPELAASVGVVAWFAAPGDHRIPAASTSIAWRPHGLGVALTGVIAPSAAICVRSRRARTSASSRCSASASRARCSSARWSRWRRRIAARTSSSRSWRTSCATRCSRYKPRWS
jgi:hypothetical protein